MILHPIIALSLVTYMPAFMFCFIGIIAYNRNRLFVENDASNIENKGRATLGCFTTVSLIVSLCQGHQKPVNDKRDMSGIQHRCLGCDSQVYSL